MINNVRNGKDWLPATLKCLLEEIIPSEVKQASIGQCIIRAARPRSPVHHCYLGLQLKWITYLDQNGSLVIYFFFYHKRNSNVDSQGSLKGYRLVAINL